MIFYLATTHKDFFKDYYELIQLFIYNFELHIEQQPSVYDIYIKEKI